jgi:RNA polymerase sigma-70 factor (ECF subfamily)
MTDKWLTRQTMVERARDQGNRQAWDDFVSFYSGFIRMVIRKMKVPVDDTDDLVQNVLLRVWRSLGVMQMGKNNAKFRTWLSTVIRNAVLQHLEQHKRKYQAASIDALAESGGRSLLLSDRPEIDELIEQEWKRHVVDLALGRIKKHFSGQAVEVLVRSLKGETVETICSTLHLTPGSVYVLRNRTKLRFMDEIRNLREELEF